MNYRNAKHISSNRIDCEIEHPKFGWIPYTVDPADTDMTINNDDLLAAMAVAGNVAAYIPPTQAELDALLANQLRTERNSLLSEVDAFVGNPLRWGSLDASTQDAWAVYRQALLDVPQQSSFPDDVAWPINPLEATP